MLDAVMAKLVAAGVLGGSPAFLGFIGYSPDANDYIVSLYNTGGSKQPTLAGDVNEETIQIRVRTAYLDYAGCEAQWRRVFNALQDQAISNSGVDIYMLQAINSGPLFFYDAKQRPNATLNMTVLQKRP